MIWFTSDQHFCHRNVLEYCPNRKFANIEEMNYTIIQNYNYKVRDDDTVFILGDLTLAPYKDAQFWISQLKGKKFLIQGNHDHFSRQQYLNLGFEEVFREATIKIGQDYVRMSHYPLRPTWFERLFNAKARDLRYMDRRPPKDGRWLLHGHTHSTVPVRGRSIHVGVDAWNLNPVSLNEIQSILDKAKKK